MDSGNTHDLVPLQYILVVGLKFSGGFWGADVDRSFQEHLEATYRHCELIPYGTVAQDQDHGLNTMVQTARCKLYS